MFRKLSAATLVAFALTSISAASAHEADQHMILSCRLAPEIKNCEAKMTEFRKTYVEAFRNNLDAQRTVARTLWRGNDVVPVDWMPACTWYMTMIALSSPKLEAVDRQNMQTACSLLSADQVETARSRARALGHRIINKDKIDTAVEAPSQIGDKKLDSTAHPL